MAEVVFEGKTTTIPPYISPTFKSSPLFKPELAPVIYRHEAKYRPAWGTHIHKYAGIGNLSFLGLGPKTRDLYVARSHRHFLSGLSYVRQDQITPSQITPFKKSLNRANDDLVPPAGDIPLENYHRLIEEIKLIREDKYASHIQTKSFISSELCPAKDSQHLTPTTIHDIQTVLQKRYGQTSHSEAFYDKGKNTTLMLGPQFQFYDTDEEEEVEKDDTELQAAESDDKIPASTDTTTSETKQSQDSPVKTCSRATSTTTLSQKQSSTSISTQASSSQESSSSLKKSSSLPSISLQKSKSTSSLNKKDTGDYPLWPCWPGNQLHVIHPVKLQISEKRDVACAQDNHDVRALPVFQKLKMPDFKLLPKLDQVSNNNVAPGSINFAYSGCPVTYGRASERSQQTDIIPIIKPVMSRFGDPLPEYLEANTDRLLREKEGYIMTPSPPRQDNRSRYMNPRFHRQREVLSEDNELEALKSTVENLREPLPEPSKCDEIIKLPPLYETLSYSGNRVVDRLGVKFKTAALQRFHQLHPEEMTRSVRYKGSTKCNSEDKNELMQRRHETRRQYYNGYHMGSTFR